MASASCSGTHAFRLSIHASKSRTSHLTSPLAKRTDGTGHSSSKRFTDRPQCSAASDLVNILFKRTFRLRVAIAINYTPQAMRIVLVTCIDREETYSYSPAY